MLSVVDIKNLLEDNVDGISFFPLAFPSNAPVNSASVTTLNAGGITAGVSEISVQIKVRDSHPASAENNSFKVRNFLQNKTSYDVGAVEVVMSEATNSVPLYIGTDENSNHIFSNNFRFILNEK